MNFYNHHIRSVFKSHSISVTFKFCAVRIALCALEPRSTDSLGTQHRTKESNTNRMTSGLQALNHDWTENKKKFTVVMHYNLFYFCCTLDFLY